MEEYIMVFEKVSNILANQFDVEESEITMTTDLSEELSADSLDYIDLINSLEDEFSIEFSDDDAEGIKTVGDIVRLIEELV